MSMRARWQTLVRTADRLRQGAPTLERPQALAVAALALLVLAGLAGLGLSFAARMETAAEPAEGRETLERLESRRTGEGPRANRASPPAAPDAAFIDAATPGLAAAQLQTHVAQAAAARNARVLSLGLEAAGRDGPAEDVRVQATLVTTLNGLQALLHDLESGTPYVFVDALTVQLQDAQTQPGTEPTLRAMVSLRALLRRRTS